MTIPFDPDEVWEALETLLETPLALREQKLDELCDGRPELRDELVSLAVAPPPDFLESSPAETWICRERPDRGLEIAAGTRFAGKYILRERVGAGSMGVVYRGEHLELGMPVAIKVLHRRGQSNEAERERLLSEARAVSGVRHDNVVAVHDIGVHDGFHYLVMEWVDGTDLARLLTRAVERGGPREPLSTVAARAAFDAVSSSAARGTEWDRPWWELLATLTASVARAAHVAHEQGIVHRDICPKNILIDPNGRPRLVDFGVATLASPEGAPSAHNSVAGTPAYMAPEQALGRSSSKRPTVDVFGIGATIYHLITGRPPFQSNDPSVLGRELAPDVRSIRADVPADLAAICFAAMEVRPEDRYPSASALADDLDAFVAREPVSRRMPGPLGRAWRWCQRRPTAAIAVVALVVLVIVGVNAGRLARREAVRAEARDRQDRFAATYALLPALATFEADARYASASIEAESDAEIGPLLDELISIEPSRPILRWLRASHASQRGNLTRTAREVDALRRLVADTDLLRLLVGRLLAADAVERNQLIAPADLPAARTPFDFAILGHTAIRWREMRRAWVALSHAIRLDPDEWLYSDLRAVAGLELVAPELYVEDALRVEAALRRSTCRTLHVRAYALRWSDPQRAEELWKECLALGGPQHQPLHNLGLLHFWDERLDDAEACLVQAARVRRGSWRSFLLLSRCARARNDFAQADEHLLSAVHDLPAGQPKKDFTPLDELSLERAHLQAAWASELRRAGDEAALRERLELATQLLAPLLDSAGESEAGRRQELEAMRVSIAIELDAIELSDAVAQLRAHHVKFLRTRHAVSPSIAVNLGAALARLGDKHRDEAEALLRQGMSHESTYADAVTALARLQ